MTDLPLQTIRVIDHTIAWAGPQATGLLADMGAEVIKIEACQRPDSMRVGGRMLGLDKFWERGHWFTLLNRNKLGITIDLKKKGGKELYFKLVKVSDVVIDNFTPRVMPNLGLDYEELKKVKPDIIVVRMPGYGTSGPYRDAPAYGPNISAFSGLVDITGYAGGPPMPINMAYGDPTAGFAAALAVLAAVHYRSLTGKGQFVDVSHLEILSKATDGVLDYAMNERIQKRIGNRNAFMAPQGCYPCRGDDKWVVITIADDQDWGEFGKALSSPEWTQDPRFATLKGRQQHHDELDRLIASWTSSRERYEVASLLQKAGIAAAPVLHPGEMLTDTHFVQRGFFEESTHPYAGAYLLSGMLCKMSHTPCHVRFPAPLFGEHNQYVFKEILGLSEDDIAQLNRDKITGNEPQYLE
ncbi:Succinyl-CoA:(R)-benzylsuccinate CoA-transferase subunit BbsF [subsurface metagenome]